MTGVNIQRVLRQTPAVARKGREPDAQRSNGERRKVRGGEKETFVRETQTTRESGRLAAVGAKERDEPKVLLKG